MKCSFSCLPDGMGASCPQGARGLKFEPVGKGIEAVWSCPARGTGIEMMCSSMSKLAAYCRAPQGARGLKLLLRVCRGLCDGRAPQGARGLKFLVCICIWAVRLVVPRKGHGD